MGTRGMVRFFETTTAAEPFAALYVQFDGYIDGLGEELKALDGVLVNGIGPASDENQYNGMGCFAASVVAKLKVRVGGHYLVAPQRGPGEAAYTYDLRPSSGDVGHLLCRVWGYDAKDTVYDGQLAGLHRVPDNDE